MRGIIVVLFAFTQKSSIVRQGVVTRAFRGVSPYVLHTWEKIRLRGSFLSLRINSRFSLRGRESYSLRSGISFQSPQDQPGGRRSSAGLADHLLNVVIVNVIKDTTNKSAALLAVCHFGQKVRKIEPSPDMADERFAHCNRFSDCMVAN